VFEILRPGKREEVRGEEVSIHETDGFVHMDLYREALFLLGRAIDDYLALTGVASAVMLRFNEEVRGKAK
jgi:hypothetical protein